MSLVCRIVRFSQNDSQLTLTYIVPPAQLDEFDELHKAFAKQPKLLLPMFKHIGAVLHNPYAAFFEGASYYEVGPQYKRLVRTDTQGRPHHEKLPAFEEHKAGKVTRTFALKGVPLYKV